MAKHSARQYYTVFVPAPAFPRPSCLSRLMEAFGHTVLILQSIFLFPRTGKIPKIDLNHRVTRVGEIGKWFPPHSGKLEVDEQAET